MPTADYATAALNDGRVELTTMGKIATRLSATADIGLRTGVATLVAGTVAPVALLSNLFEEQYGAADFYREAAARSADENFPMPDGPPDVRVHRIEKPALGGARKGRVELIRYPSRFTGFHPDRQGKIHGPNGTAWAQHWRHEVGPRPTLIVSHGFLGSGYLFNSAFFSLPALYRQGYDVVLVTLPHHGRRRDPGSLYSGSGMFSDGLVGMGEHTAQAIHDIRSLVTYLLDEVKAPQVAMTGLSLGGYTTALMAATEERLVAAVPNSAVVDLPKLIEGWTPMSQLLRMGLRRGDLAFDDFASAFTFHSALNYPAKVPHDGLFVIGGLGDRLAPPEQSRALWEHWNRPRLHWFPGNHVLHVDRSAYHRRMVRFFHEIGFAA